MGEKPYVGLDFWKGLLNALLLLMLAWGALWLMYYLITS